MLSHSATRTATPELYDQLDNYGRRLSRVLSDPTSLTGSCPLKILHRPFITNALKSFPFSQNWPPAHTGIVSNLKFASQTNLSSVHAYLFRIGKH
jgi:hypothetical protein